MNNNEAADIVEYLVGAYPGTYFSGPTAEVFTNSLKVSDYDTGKQAATEWVQTTDRFPTIAELNGLMRRIRDRGNAERELPRGRYEVADRAKAREAFSRGYIRARTEVGESMEDINPKLERLLKQWNLHPSNGAEHPARTG